MDIICPHCKTTLEGDESFVGSNVTCPACNRDFSVPKLVASKQGPAVPKPVALSVVPVGVAPRRIPAVKRKKNGIVLGVASGALAVLFLIVFLARERNYRVKHLYRTVAENVLAENLVSSLGVEENYKEIFFEGLKEQARESISPLYSMRNIRSLFGDRRVLFEDERDFGELMVANGLNAVNRVLLRMEMCHRLNQARAQSKAKEQYYLNHTPKENISPEPRTASSTTTGVSTNPDDLYTKSAWRKNANQ